MESTGLVARPSREWARRAWRALRSLLVSVLMMALLSAIAQVVTQTIASMQGGGGGGVLGRLLGGGGEGALTEHERSLSAHVTRPADDTPPARLDELGGLADVKADLRTSVLLPLQAPRAFFGGGVRGLEPSRGVLLVGAPGTGKTTLVRALAAESGAALLALTLSALEDKYVGESSKRVAAAFTLAAKLQPCVLFFDEIDGLMRERAPDESSSSYGLKTELLMHLDRLQQQRAEAAVVVIGATNNARLLDPALRRRLPKVYHLPPPARAEREAILRGLLARHEPEGRCRALRTVRGALLDATDGFTGSDLSELYRRAAAARLRRQAQDARFLETLRERPTDATLEPIAEDEWDAALKETHRTREAAQTQYCAGHDGAAANAAERLMRTLLPSTATAPRAEARGGAADTSVVQDAVAAEAEVAATVTPTPAAARSEGPPESTPPLPHVDGEA